MSNRRDKRKRKMVLELGETMRNKTENKNMETEE